MKIAVAQIRPEIGHLERNIQRHMALVRLSKKHLADLVIFPELSLTGYEPTRAQELSRSADEPCFDRLQRLSDRSGVSVGVGFPLRTSALPQISNLLIRPNAERLLYSKRYLHADEKPFFDPGTNCDSTISDDPKIALAICYELSIPEHARHAFDVGSSSYIVSAAKTARGIEDANGRLAEIAKQHSAIVMLANGLGVQDGVECIGHSAAWGRDGKMLAQLDSRSEGVIVVDDETEAVVSENLACREPNDGR